MLLALKIDVDTLRGTREGVPRLVELLQQHGAGATFLFSLGPDHTGRAIKRVFRPGFLRQGARAPRCVEHYGLQTLLYGTLLPGPGHRPALRADVMRAVRDAGFEVGIHAWDHVRWQDGVARRRRRVDARARCSCAVRALHRDLRRAAPRSHGAAGWQMNAHALRLTQRARLRLLLRRPRHAPASCRCGTPSSSAARSCRRRCRRSTS